ncbi:caspase family protein [Streptomyces sp. NPDC001663]|uniref:HD domain-containing protein n=1 Tax=Streptomyces sp. NPDC001663 TaxID=3364597 RepID=UPI00369670D0
MGTLRALLIASPKELDFVRKDTARIKEALLGSGYDEPDVTVLDTVDKTGRTSFYTQLNTFFGRCEDDDFALVYFSGHGVNIDGIDYMVPSDAARTAGRQSLIAVVPDELLEKLTTRATVMVCVDACRDDAGEEFLPPPAAPSSSRLRENVVLLQSCAAGEQAMGTNEGSFLGRALAEALANDSPPRTVGEVLDHARRRTEQIAGDNGCITRHRVDIRWLSGSIGQAPAEHAGREICRTGPGVQEWTRAMHASRLWKMVPDGEADTGRLRDLLSHVIDKVLAIRRAAERRNTPDSWEDPQFPERVLKQLDRLVPAAPDGRLSPLEAVTLLGTPFVREAAVACGLRALAELHPPQGPDAGEELPSREPGDEIRHHLAEDMADVRNAYRHIETKRRRLRDEGAAPDVVAAAEQWLRHRLLADWDQLWYSATGSGRSTGALDSLKSVVELLTDVAEYAVQPDEQTTPTSRERLRSALMQVVMQMRTRPAETAPNGEVWNTKLPKILSMSRRMWWRPRELAGLLHIAELLAIDPRTLDGIVVDHLGADHHQVKPGDLIQQIRDSDFRPVRENRAAPSDWTLQADCGNAALHVALERQTDAAADAARGLSNDLSDADLFAALPKHINTDALEPAGTARYEAPPPRFQLAEDGIKPLIMGTQLYGDRMLAVRELYQNALDACRRRHARQRYAALTGEIDESDVKDLADYAVSFTLGQDAEGLYIECVDDGIGMTVEELRDLFSRAGRRYEQSPRSVREIRRWRRVGVIPELNSRFGIGAFSYFMLAEKIRVTTRPAGPNGQGDGGPGHRVDVVADSGLMHIRGDGTERVGTCVRLYLRPEFCLGEIPSLIEALREQVWLSPVTLRAEEKINGKDMKDQWSPGVLRPDATLAVQEEETGQDIWWVQGRGARLVDGIFVGAEPRPHGYVINLRHRHRPVLSADRNRLQDYAVDQVLDELVAAAEKLTQWKPIPIEWLWELAKDDVILAELVVGRLLATDIRVSVNKWYGDGHYFDVGGNDWRFARYSSSLARLGCLPFDTLSRHDIMKSDHDTAGTGLGLFYLWRSQLVDVGAIFDRESSPVIGWPKGFPEPTAVDTLLFRDLPDFWIWNPLAAALQAAEGSMHSLRSTVRTLRRYAVAGIHVPETDDIRGLDDVDCPAMQTRLYAGYDRALTLQTRAQGTEPPVHAPLLLEAGRERKTIGEATRLVRQLRRLDARIPDPPDPGDLDEHIPDQAEGVVLSGSRTPGLDGLPAVVTPMVAAYMAVHSNTEPADTASTARRYARFGYRVAGALESAHISIEEARALGLTDSWSAPERFNKYFGVLGLVRLSAERGDPDVGTTVQDLGDLAQRLELGWSAPEALLSVKAPSWWASLSTYDTRPAQPVGNWTVLQALNLTAESESLEAEDEAVRALAEAGVVHASAADAVRTARESERRLLHLSVPFGYVSSERSGGEAWRYTIDTETDHVSTALLVVMSAENFNKIGVMAEEVQEEAAPYGISVADVPPETRDLQPERAECKALCTSDNVTWKAAITHREIITYADECGVDLVEAMSQLRAYEPLGAPKVPDAIAVPASEAGDQQRQETEEVHRAIRKLFLFEPLRQGTVTPLALTITAARLDRGLRATFRALAPYAACGVTFECPEPADDHEPDWRDVIILTQRLTGREPALSGTVTDDHIQLAAEETELTPDDVRGRLAYYAPLFGFQLPQEGDTHAGS